MGPYRTVLFAVMAFLALDPSVVRADGPKRPVIRKLGTLDLDMVETTPRGLFSTR